MAQAPRLLLTLLIGLGIGVLLGRQIAPEPAVVVIKTPPARESRKPLDPATAAAQAMQNFNALRAYLAEWFPSLAEAAPVEDINYSAERVLYDQRRLLDEALRGLRKQTPGQTDLYVLAFAGDGDEEVFRNEVEYVERLFAQRFGAQGRVLVLENSPATVTQRPLATVSNLELALDGLLKDGRFDPDEDILLLFMTSHGDEDHYLYVGMDDLPLDWIHADDLARVLNTRPFRWRVGIISACYSGGFVDALKNSTSMVITAARSDRTSFGCGSDSDITWFGKAFFVEGLNQNDSFRGAFEMARQLVQEWEVRDGETPSEPQIASTPLIEAKLAQWRHGIRPGPPLPFATAAQAAQESEKSTKQ
jgi:Peptidase C13 family